MPLWRREGFVEDKWAFLGEDAPVPAEGAIVVPLKRWLAERGTLAARLGPSGSRLRPARTPRRISPISPIAR